jgi:hypothetical protein
LSLACSYQAAWLNAQPDYLTRDAVSSAAQDGQSATGAHGDWLTLSPLARKATKRLSWRGTRNLSTGAGASREARLAALGDDALAWRPI